LANVVLNKNPRPKNNINIKNFVKNIFFIKN